MVDLIYNVVYYKDMHIVALILYHTRITMQMAQFTLFWHGANFDLTCVKLLWYMVTIPNINNIQQFMYFGINWKDIVCASRHYDGWSLNSTWRQSTDSFLIYRYKHITLWNNDHKCYILAQTQCIFFVHQAILWLIIVLNKDKINPFFPKCHK